MKQLPNEEFRAPAEVCLWSADHAQGYIDGEISRLRGKQPSKHVLIGIDEYSLGFRAGYFERRQVPAARTAEESPSPD